MAKSGENVALEWTRAELMDTLESARRRLEAYAEARAEGMDATASDLSACVADLHQAHGVFVMLELQSAASLAAHLEAVASALGQGSLSDPDAAAETLMQGLLELPEYLEAHRSGLGDSVVPLLPVLNALRAHLGQPPLAPGRVEPAFAAAPDPRVLERFAAVDGLDKVRKVRSVYQQVLLAVLKGGIAPDAVETLDKVAVSMQRLCQGTPQGVLWQLFEEYLQALLTTLDHQPGPLGSDVVKLLRRMDSELRALAQEGAAALAKPVPAEVLQLLINAARARGRTSAFLDELEQSLSASEMSEALASSGRRALASAAAALRDDLAGVRDQIDLLLRGALGDDGDADGHAGLLRPLRQINSTMALLGLESSRAIIAEQIDVLTGPVVDPAMLESMVDALAQVDENLAGLSLGGKSEAELILDSAQQAVIAEARRGLELLKQSVVDYVSSQWDVRHLQGLTESLAGITSALRMIPLTDAAALIDRCIAYLTQALLSGHVPDWEELDQFAGAVSGVDYYLERVAGPSTAGAEEILAYAQRSLAALAPRAGVSQAADAIETVVAADSPSVEVAPPPPALPEAAFPPAPEAAPVVSAEREPAHEGADEPEWAAQEPARQDLEAAAAALSAWQIDAAAPSADEGFQQAEVELELFEQPAEQPDHVDAESFREPAEPESANEIGLYEAWSAADQVGEVEPERGLPTGPAAEDAAGHFDPALQAVQERLAGLEDTLQVDDDILEVFLEEVDEVLAVVDERLPPWQQDIGEGQHAVELRRAFHTLKGSGRLVGARVLGELAWSIEQMLNRVIDGSIDATPELQALIGSARELVPGLRAAFAEHLAPDLAAVAGVVARAERIAAGEVEAEAAPEVLSASESDEVVVLEQAGPAAAESLADALEALASAPSEDDSVETEGAAELVAEPEFPTLWEVEAEVAASDSLPAAESISATEGETASATGDSPDHVDALEMTGPEIGEPQAIEAIEAPVAEVPAESAAGPVGAGVDTLAVFRDEAREHLAALAAGRDQDHWRLDETVARALHTLAGSAAMVGVPVVAELARAALDMVQAMLGSRETVELDDAAAAFLRAVHDAFEGDLERLDAGIPLLGHRELIDEADRLRREAPVASLIQAVLALPGLDALLDAQNLLQDWLSERFDAARHAALVAVLAELYELAEPPEYQALAELAGALGAAHGRLAGARLEGAVADTLLAAHERLLGQIDALVVGQPLRGAGELLAMLADVDAPSLEQSEALEQFESTDQEIPVPRAPVFEEAVTEPAEVAQVPMMHAATEPLAAPVERDSAEPAAEAVDPELVGIFLEEAEELLDAMDQAVQACAEGRDTQGAIEALLRALHTLKGGARLAGLAAAGDSAHDFESWLIAVRDGGSGFDAAALARLHDQYDGLASLIGVAAGHEEPEEAEAVAASLPLGAEPLEQAAPTVSALETAEPAPESAAQTPPEGPAPSEPETAPPMAAQAPEPAPSESAAIVALPAAAAERRPPEVAADRGTDEVVRVRASLLDQLVNLAGESSIIRGRVQQGLAEFGGALDEMETTIQRLREQLRRLEIETEAQILFRRERTESPGYEDFDPLEFDRYSQLQQLSRSLSESASDMLDLKETLRQRAGDTEALLVQQSRISTQLQEGLMRSRMEPFSRLLPRLRRTVRQVAQDLGKSVELLAYNVEGELDRSLLDRMVAPLEHMLRNAVDHGIELPEQRRAAGKPETGRIELRVAREAGDVVIEIRDDGAGIDLERVRSKAITQGLMPADADLSDDEIRQFVFAPGFSTARSVTQISGRGVGMDVAYSAVKKLGGSIGLTSEPGQGTAFLMRVPFTVSVNRALMVSVGDDLYAVPLNTIEGIVLVRGDEISAPAQRGNPTIEYAGVVYQVRHLGEYLARPVRAGNPSGSVPVVLVRSGDRAVAVQVDAVQGSREIVVKGLGPQFAGVAGISGATILGDGGVVVILDLPALVRGRRERTAVERKRGAAKPRARTTVLVVDDSVTVRKVTSRLLERQGMEVVLAKDGVEAVAMLQEFRPDIMLLDIEMPRMDGFEVLRHVRHDNRLADLPVIMISSRSGAKHKDRAAELGVSHFLGKPFQETELLAVIDEFLSHSSLLEAAV